MLALTKFLNFFLSQFFILCWMCHYHTTYFIGTEWTKNLFIFEN